MCGVGGIFHFGRSETVTSRHLANMNHVMEHRGPDGQGSYVSKNGRLGLCHRRLSIIDLSENASQPMPNSNETIWVSYNGEIYNHRVLRLELEAAGYVFKSSHSDTEVLVHGYEYWGIRRLLFKLEGMFAFVVWDENKSKLIVARDRVGIKPMYFSKQNGVFICGSEIKALLTHPSINARASKVALYHYLTYLTTPAPLTMFDGIFKVPAAHYLEVNSDGMIGSFRYWSPEPGMDNCQDQIKGLEEDSHSAVYQRLIKDCLERAVEKRMMSDAPYGAFLSGGIDSSINVALMDRFSANQVNTFSVGFSDYPELNELDYASKVAKHFNTNHHEILINEKDMTDYLGDLIVHQDEPLADWVCIPLHFVSKLAQASGIKVIQVGEGSDEQFCGYNSYMQYLKLYHNYFVPFNKYFPDIVKNLIAQSAVGISKINTGFEIYADAIMRATKGQEAFWSGAIGYWELQKANLFPHGFYAGTPYGAEELLENGLLPESYLRLDSSAVAKSFLDYFDKMHPGRDQLTRMIYSEFQLRLPELLLMRVDKITMASSLEARVPFLDHNLVELTMNIPMSQKIGLNVPKYLLKKTAEGLIPKEIIYRKKMGFSAPMAQWLRGEFGNQVKSEILASPLLDEIQLDANHVSSMIDTHRSGRGDKSLLIWVLFNLTSWHRHWIEQVKN